MNNCLDNLVKYYIDTSIRWDGDTTYLVKWWYGEMVNQMICWNNFNGEMVKWKIMAILKHWNGEIASILKLWNGGGGISWYDKSTFVVQIWHYKMKIFNTLWECVMVKWPQ